MAADRTSFDDTSFDRAFSAALGRFLPLCSRQGLITALSGGADSTALCLLAARYADAHGLAHRAIIIDHGLRVDSPREAKNVADRMRDRSIDVQIITIEQKYEGGGIQEWARHVRYDALLDQARQDSAGQGNTCLLLAHHAGDQAETVGMRLSHGSGLNGLAGMAAHSNIGDVTVLRPMLEWPAARSRQICAASNCAYEEDPSNQDRRFERVRIRQMLAAAKLANAAPAMSQQLTRLAALARRLGGVVDDHLADYVPALHPAGYAVLDNAGLEVLSDLLWNRVIIRLLGHVAAGHYPPSGRALAVLRERFDAGKAATLGGCKFTPKGDEYLVTREIGRTPPQRRVEAGRMVLFGNLWRITPPQDGTLTLLGHQSPHCHHRKDCKGVEIGVNPHEIYKNIPHLARIAIPVFDTLDGKRLYPQIKGVKTSLPASLGYSLDHCYASSDETPVLFASARARQVLETGSLTAL